MKSIAPNTELNNIYYLDKVESFLRIEIQSSDDSIIDKIIQNFINEIDCSIDLLLKEHSSEYDEDDEIIWNYYVGKTYKEKLLKIFDEYKEYIFSDGMIQFLCRNVETGEYLCLDDHGILFIYYNNSIIQNEWIIELKEVKDRSEFVTATGHWHRRNDNSEMLLNNFIKELELKND